MTGRGRPRKPVNLKVLDGTFRADRDLATSFGLSADGAPERPAGLSPAAAEFWDRWVPYLVERGVAKAVDAPALKKLCFWWARSEALNEATEQIPVGSKKYYRAQYLASQADAKFRQWCAVFGFTPPDRAKMPTDKPQETGVKRRDRSA